MKRNVFWLGLLAMVLTFGITVVGCDDGSGDPTPQTETYRGTANGTTYTLKITENTARYAAQSGDAYELSVGAKKSTGTVENVSGGNLTLKPSNAEATFTASVSSGGISGFTGSITFDGDTTPTTLPSEVTPTPPSTGGGNAAKTLVITGYPGSMEAGNVHFTSIAAVGTDYSVLQNSIVAVASDYPEEGWNFVTISGTTATMRLMSPDANWENFTNWTGSGTYDVWIAPKGTSEGSSWYKAGGVSFIQATTTIAASSFVFQVVQGPDNGGSNPAPKFTGVQIYTLDDDGVFTAFSGTGTEMDIEGIMHDNYGQYYNLGKIGTMSSDGKLTFELPSTIADDKLFLVPTEYGGNGVIKFVLVNIRVYSDNSDDDYYLELYNSSNTNKEVNFQYYDRDFSVMGLSIKRGWNYVEMNWDDDSPQIIFDISNHKWVIEER